jgi:hypothetical protein
MYGLAKYLAGLFCPLVRQSDHYIKNSEAFIKKLHHISLQETNILVSFDISLFTKAPVGDTLLLLS